MSRVLVIGCGGVASVAIHKICQVSDVFTDLCIASRTVSKCDVLAEELKGNTKTNITTAKVDADNTDEVIALINKFKPDVVLNVALPYQDLTIMDACLACKVPYVDTANYECEDTDILSGERCMRKDANASVLQHILTIHGSGLTGKNIKRQELRDFWELALTRVLQVYLQHMHRNTI